MKTTKSNLLYLAIWVNCTGILGRCFAHEKDDIIDPEALANISVSYTEDEWKNWTDWDTWEAKTEVQNLLNYYRLGYDYDGLNVYSLEFGKADFRVIARQTEENSHEFWKNHEQFLRRIEADGALNDDQGIVLIIDFDGFSLRSFASTNGLKVALRTISSIVRLKNVLRYGFGVHVNFATETFLSLARPFLGDILTRIELYGTRADLWKHKLIRKIPRDQLPEKYGGVKDWKPLPCRVLPSE